MKFFVSRNNHEEIKISRLIKIYKESFEVEKLLGENNIFHYEDSWNDFLINKKDIIDTVKVEFILAIFPKEFCKRFTERIILNHRNNLIGGHSLMYDNDSVREKEYLFNDYCIRSTYNLDKHFQEINIPIDKLIFDKNKLTKRNYIIQLSLLTLNK